MKIYTEKNLRNFEFLGGAIDFVTRLTLGGRKDRN